MDRPQKHRATDFEKFLDYFKGLFSNKDQHLFEKEVMQDPFAEEAFEGLSKLSPDELTQDVHELQAGVADRTKTRKTILLPVFRIAAAALLLLIAGTTVILIRNSIKKAPAMQDMAEVLDTLAPQRIAAPPDKDSLNENIAYLPQKKKEETPVARRVFKSDRDAGDQEFKAEAYVADNVEEEMEIILPLEEEFEGSYAAEEMEMTTSPSENVDQSLQGVAAGIQIRGQASHLAKGPGKPNGQMAAYAFTDELKGERRTISGLVIEEESGEPLPGVSVHVKGTEQGTLTDIRGQFELDVPAQVEAFLTFAYVGYETEEVAIEDQEDITLALGQDIMALDEVVVVGYGTAKRSEVTGAVSAITAEDLNAEPQAPSVVLNPGPDCKSREFKDYIRDNIRYDQLPKLEKAVVVKLRFTITTSGEIYNISVLKSGGKAFDEEAIRLLKEGPAWLPGSIDGVVTEDDASLKIKFEPLGD